MRLSQKWDRPSRSSLCAVRRTSTAGRCAHPWIAVRRCWTAAIGNRTVTDVHPAPEPEMNVSSGVHCFRADLTVRIARACDLPTTRTIRERANCQCGSAHVYCVGLALTPRRSVSATPASFGPCAPCIHGLSTPSVRRSMDSWSSGTQPQPSAPVQSFSAELQPSAPVQRFSPEVQRRASDQRSTPEVQPRGSAQSFSPELQPRGSAQSSSLELQPRAPAQSSSPELQSKAQYQNSSSVNSRSVRAIPTSTARITHNSASVEHFSLDICWSRSFDDVIKSSRLTALCVGRESDRGRRG